ncbi:WhiB family transcriptional regulator [uncultured Micrococcus sp.]|uniref:WhiB family transcriptional regulator n=1 Tax=uncultured Micrococcus sp. TaxID=114051 RepID=UPI0026272C4D|nr:WhiB family transcriptional regulator [uncultured Micrococcus sp.]
MESMQRAEDAFAGESRQAAARARAVPSDWFLDPADPAAGWAQEEGLEAQASAFLAALDVDDAPRATVTALFPQQVPQQPAPAVAPAVGSPWEALPGVVTEPVEGDLAWQVDALCAQTDPEAFFPEKGGSTREAKKVCAACDVRRQCLDYAMANDERFGIWGGLSERERRRLRRERG